MSRRVQPQRRANIRRTIQALRQGTPERAAHHVSDWQRWPRWVAGMRRAAMKARVRRIALRERPSFLEVPRRGRKSQYLVGRLRYRKLCQPWPAPKLPARTPKRPRSKDSKAREPLRVRYRVGAPLPRFVAGTESAVRTWRRALTVTEQRAEVAAIRGSAIRYQGTAAQRFRAAHPELFPVVQP